MALVRAGILRGSGLYTVPGRAFLSPLLARPSLCAPSALRGTSGGATMTTPGGAGTIHLLFPHVLGAPASLIGSKLSVYLAPAFIMLALLAALFLTTSVLTQRGHRFVWGCALREISCGATMTTPGGAGTTVRNACLSHPPCARRTGFSHGSELPTLLGSGHLHGSSGRWVSEDREGLRSLRGKDICRRTWLVTI